MKNKTLKLEESIRKAEENEIRIFFEKAREFYNTTAKQGEELYNIASDLTNDFADLNEKTIVEDPRIIKILRFLSIPVFSQMKLGQFIGISSTGDFENGRKIPLAKARDIIAIVKPNIDYSRLIWLNTKLKDDDQMKLAKDYAKSWTCSLIANQNSLTVFRNWRKEIQENHIVEAILSASYSKSSRKGMIKNITDVLPGEFLSETKIEGRSVQKADFVVRLKTSSKLLMIEAKAVGVKIDAYKRLKEIRDKGNDWGASLGPGIIVGTVLGGFIPLTEVENLLKTGIKVYWEHDLAELKKDLSIL